MIAYCAKTGQAPTASRDWTTEQRVVSAIEPDGFYSYDNDPERPDATAALLADYRAGIKSREGEPLTPTRDAAQAVLDDERRAVTSHMARNGNPPQGHYGPGCGPADVDRNGASLRNEPPVLDGLPDSHGGKLAIGLKCPDCAGPVRFTE